VLPYLPPPAFQQALQADADVEAGPQQQYTTGLRPPSPVPNGFRHSAGTNGTSELLQPLLSPEPAQQSALPELGVGPSAGFDPFPATTAARAKAATVARMRALAPGPTDHLRAAMLGRSAATAVTTIAGKSTAEARFQRQLTFASSLSWAVNILLLVAKLYAYWLSQSKAVLASAADSAVDLVSQWGGWGWGIGCLFVIVWVGGWGWGVQQQTDRLCRSAVVMIASTPKSQRRVSVSTQQPPSLHCGCSALSNSTLSMVSSCELRRGPASDSQIGPLRHSTGRIMSRLIIIIEQLSAHHSVCVEHAAGHCHYALSWSDAPVASHRTAANHSDTPFCTAECFPAVLVVHAFCTRLCLGPLDVCCLLSCP